MDWKKLKGFKWIEMDCKWSDRNESDWKESNGLIGIEVD